ncbi:hypothetical protein RB195_003938 [Necator americanus]|uniref:Uncharacterized protein n=1 Tax=Necator americanus TaxID=51031 RepID=A0ABR1DRE0_NECAM
MSTATDEDTSMDIPNYNDPAYCKSILSAILVELYIYIGVSFKEPHISATSTPDEVTGRINEVLIFNVSCSTITMTIMIVLLLTNKKRKTKSIGCVSRRFQIDENIVTTEFIAKIAFVQLVAFSIQSLGGLILRSSLENFFTDNDLPALKSIKLSLQVMPIFTIIVCVVIEWSICRTTTRHRARVLSMVNIKDRGHHSLQFLSLQWSNANLKLPQMERNTVC